MSTDPGINTSTADDTQSVDEGINAQDANSDGSQSGTQSEDTQGNPQPDLPDHSDLAGDDGDDNDDSGDDVDISSAGNNFKVGIPAAIPSPFAQYASHMSSEAAQAVVDAVMGRNLKQFVANGTSEPTNTAPVPGQRLHDVVPAHDATSDTGGIFVAAATATVDGNALRIAEAQLSEATRANFNTSELQAKRDALRAPLLSPRAAMPVTRSLDPLARTPTTL